MERCGGWKVFCHVYRIIKEIPNIAMKEDPNIVTKKEFYYRVPILWKYNEICGVLPENLKINCGK